MNVVPFFQGADPLFVSGVVAKLKHEVYQPGDYVIMEGTIGTKMFFIQQGTVDVVTNNGSCVAQLFDGSYFGGELQFLHGGEAELRITCNTSQAPQKKRRVFSIIPP